MEIAIQENSKYGLVVSSRVIARELGKRHAHILRDLDKILENPNVGSLIILSFYRVSNQTRQYKEYLLTKDGFTLYMFNIQGYQDFKLAYINKFNEMEEKLLKLEFGNNKKLIERIQKLEDEINKLPMSWCRFEAVKDQIDETASKRMEINSMKGSKIKTALKEEIEKDLFLRFGIDSLYDLKHKDYFIVMRYINAWIEPYKMRGSLIQ